MHSIEPVILRPIEVIALYLPHLALCSVQYACTPCFPSSHSKLANGDGASLPGYRMQRVR